MIEASFLFFLPLFSNSFTALNLIVAFFFVLQIYALYSRPLNLIEATRGQDRCGFCACDRTELVRYRQLTNNSTALSVQIHKAALSALTNIFLKILSYLILYKQYILLENISLRVVFLCLKMISIALYRARIGSFAFTAQRNVKCIAKSIVVGSDLSNNALLKLLRPVRFIALFTLLCFAIPKSFELTEFYTPLDFLNLSRNGIFVQYPNGVNKSGDPNLIFLKVNYTLLLSGDVELNPGPSVQGSFHQGNSKFGETAGIQCSSNCFFAICYAQFRKLSLWKAHDLDYVLDQGDLNFKKLGISGQSPFIEEFSKTIDIGGSTCALTFNIFEGYFEAGNISVNFVQEDLLLQHSGAVLVIAGNCLAVMHYSKNYFLFDPHSRDSDGHQVEGGASVLLKFDSLQKIKQYVRSEYENTNLFNIIYLKTDFDDQENIKNTISGEVLRRQKNSSKKRLREKIQGTDKHEQEKKNKRQRRELIKGSEKHEQEKELKRKRWE